MKENEYDMRRNPHCPVVDVDGVMSNGKQFDLDITLPQDNRNVIYGVIKDCYREPVKDAVVKLIEIECGRDGMKKRTPVAHTFTDKHGEFVFGPLCPDKEYAIDIWVNDVRHFKLTAKCHHEGSCLKGGYIVDCGCMEEKEKYEYMYKYEKDDKYEDKKYYDEDKYDYKKEEKKEYKYEEKYEKENCKDKYEYEDKKDDYKDKCDDKKDDHKDKCECKKEHYEDKCDDKEDNHKDKYECKKEHYEDKCDDKKDDHKDKCECKKEHYEDKCDDKEDDHKDKCECKKEHYDDKYEKEEDKNHCKCMNNYYGNPYKFMQNNGYRR